MSASDETTAGPAFSKAYLVSNPLSPNVAVQIDEQLCKGCNKCVDVCHSDVMARNPDKGGPPLVLYPDECWFCGCCVAHCPEEGAIRVEFPLCQRIGWKRKDTGEYFRIGMKDPPPPNARPPVG